MGITSMLTLPSSSLLSSSAPLSRSPSMGWKTTAAFGIGLPLVERNTVTLIVAVGGGGVYLRLLSCPKAREAESSPANNSTKLDILRYMLGSIDDFGGERPPDALHLA